jgi:hypothetical protein
LRGYSFGELPILLTNNRFAVYVEIFLGSRQLSGQSNPAKLN